MTHTGVAAPDLPPPSPPSALDRVLDFRQRHGAASLRLAAHAAVLERMRPDVVALLRRNFLPGADRAKAWLDSDVLNGPLTQRLGGGYYRIERAVRRPLLDLLDQMPGRGEPGFRSAQVARFVRHYAAWAARSHRLGGLPAFREYLKEIGWVALALDEPQTAAEGLYGLLAESAAAETTGAARVRLGGVASLLSLPMATMQDEVRYAVAQDRLAEGDIDGASRLMAPIAHRSFSYAGVDLPPPAALLEQHSEHAANRATRSGGDSSLGPAGTVLATESRPAADPALDTPILAAVRARDHAALATALERAPEHVDTPDSAGAAPLHLAARLGDIEAARLLLDAGADIGLATGLAGPPLFTAASWGHEAVAQLLLAGGADVDRGTPKSASTALHAAAHYGHAGLVRLLLAAGADVAVANRDGFSALVGAANCGNLEILDMLLAAGASIPAPGDPRLDLVAAAANGGHPEIMARFIRAGWPIDRRSADGWSPLLITTCRGNAACTELLLDFGANPDEFNAGGWCGLAVASHWNFPDVVRTLLRHGASPNVTGSDGQTPLLIAAEQNAADAIAALLESDQTDVEATNRNGQDALAVAVAKKYAEALDALLADPRIRRRALADDELPGAVARAGEQLFLPFIRRVYAGVEIPANAFFVAMRQGTAAAVHAMLEAGASPDLLDADGQSAVEVAVQVGRPAHLRFLLEAGARTGEAGALLHRAVRRDASGELAALLLQHGVDANAPGANGDTPLHRAAAHDHAGAARVLLAAGADPLLRNADGVAPLDFAVEADSAELVALLLAAGADPDAPSARPALTPLQRAATFGAERACRVLLGAGADRLLAAPGAAPPIELALANDHAALVALLRQHRG